MVMDGAGAAAANAWCKMAACTMFPSKASCISDGAPRTSVISLASSMTSISPEAAHPPYTPQPEHPALAPASGSIQNAGLRCLGGARG